MAANLRTLTIPYTCVSLVLDSSILSSFCMAGYKPPTSEIIIFVAAITYFSDNPDKPGDAHRSYLSKIG